MLSLYLNGLARMIEAREYTIYPGQKRKQLWNVISFLIMRKGDLRNDDSRYWEILVFPYFRQVSAISSGLPGVRIPVAAREGSHVINGEFLEGLLYFANQLIKPNNQSTN